jgi:hypothetical protein
MQMEDGLTGALQAIRYQTETLFGNSRLLCQRDCRSLELAQQLGVSGLSFQERWNVLTRYQQKVHRCLRIDVSEGKNLVVLIDDFGGKLTRGDLAEQAFGHR